jgi:DMSO/TMAO reductase YedYZ molybdopterin-dependent catalytic subunit
VTLTNERTDQLTRDEGERVTAQQTMPAAPASEEHLVVVKAAPFNAESPAGCLAADVTPANGFYVRSNFAVPALDQARHRIAVGGAVHNALDLGVDDLRTLGTKTILSTLECAGNNRMSLAPLPSGEPWLGGAVSTGAWTGVPLRAVLDRAGVKPEAVEILVTGADRGKPKDGPADIPFARSLPLAKALHADTLLALDLNGEPLPAHHGAPVRLLVPGWYGMASVKWVTRIDAVTEPFRGYYQANRYIFDFGDGTPPVPVDRMRVKSTIVAPVEGEAVDAGRIVVRGKAWSGAGQIVKVEVAIDGGETWQEARLGLAPESPYAWRSWEYEWHAADPGRHALRARATDSAGNVQPDAARWNKYGYGSNGARPVTVNVR